METFGGSCYDAPTAWQGSAQASEYRYSVWDGDAVDRLRLLLGRWAPTLNPNWR